jgi:hypothetical protein
MVDSVKAMVEVVYTVGLAIRAATEQSPLRGVPSGALYARLMAYGMTLDTYNQIIGLLTKKGLITNKGHLLQWVGPKNTNGAAQKN